MSVGLIPINSAFGAGAAVVVVGANTWVNPGISEDNFCTPRPLVVELLPELDEPGAASPDNGVGLDEVKGVGLDAAPTNERDVVGAVVVVDVFAGATVFDAVGV